MDEDDDDVDFNLGGNGSGGAGTGAMAPVVPNIHDADDESSAAGSAMKSSSKDDG